MPTRALKKPVAAEIRTVFDAPSEAEAKRLIERFIPNICNQGAKFADCAETAFPEGLPLLRFHCKRLRTSNAIEVANREIKRRTLVVKLFPNEASCLRLVGAAAMDIS